ncbi:MAG: hypothetical protein V3S39_04740 [Thermodesulfobacteriota bacterium]
MASLVVSSLGGDDGSGRGKGIRLGAFRATLTSSFGLGAGRASSTSSFGLGGKGGVGAFAGNLGSPARDGGVSFGLAGEGKRARLEPDRGSCFRRVSLSTFRETSDNAVGLSGLTDFLGLGRGITSTKKGLLRSSLGWGR